MKHSTSSSLVTRFSDYCLLKGVSSVSSYSTGRCLNSCLFALYSNDYDRYCTLLEFYVIGNYLLNNPYNKIVAFIDKFLSREGYNFTLSEFLRSDTATALRLNNKLFGVKRLYIIHFLSLVSLLQQLRLYAMCPLLVTSGYRSRLVNQAVGGRSCSRHLLLKAADITIPSRSCKTLKDIELFAKTLPFRYVHNYGTYLHIDIE